MGTLQENLANPHKYLQTMRFWVRVLLHDSDGSRSFFQTAPTFPVCASISKRSLLKTMNNILHIGKARKGAITQIKSLEPANYRTYLDASDGSNYVDETEENGERICFCRQNCDDKSHKKNLEHRE